MNKPKTKKLTDYERRVLERAFMDVEYVLSFIVDGKDSIAQPVLQAALNIIEAKLKED